MLEYVGSSVYKRLHDARCPADGGSFPRICRCVHWPLAECPLIGARLPGLVWQCVMEVHGSLVPD